MLGVVTCRPGDGRAIVPGRRERALLAALAVDRDRAWSTDELADAIWGDEPPAAATKVVRNRVSHLRRSLGAAIVDSVGPAYRLGASVRLDIDDLGDALPAGRPFADVEDWPPAWPAIARAGERVLAAQEEALAAQLRDPADDAVALAEALVAAAPERDRRWVLLVRSLHAVGRHRAALDAATRARRTYLEAGLPVTADLGAAEREVLAALDIEGDDGAGRAPYVALLGRDTDIELVRDLLDAGHRLVTLTGPGGVGKTALATAVTAHVDRARFPDGVWRCDLAVVADSDQVLGSVAARLGLRPDGGALDTAALAAALRLRRGLLVLDNAEHVVDSIAPLAAALERLPTIAVLVTSREALGLPFETVHRVRPLGPAEAVALFRRRAGALGVGVDHDPGAVRALCDRLDRLPLAIELAAAHAAAMAPAELSTRLGSLRADRAGDARHRSLDALVDWSYATLGARDRTVFQRLAVFAGSFDLAAAEAVCGAAGLEPDDVGRAVLSLVSKSMVVAVEPGRFILLDTLRDAAARRLHESGGVDDAAAAHASHFAALAVAAHRGLQGAEPARWCDELDRAWDDVRTAFSWSLAHGRADLAATIATRTTWAAVYHDVVEPLAWIDAVRAHAGDRATPDVLGAAAWAAFERGDVVLAEQLATSAHDGTGDDVDGFADLTLQSVAFLQGRIEDAERIVERAEARARRARDPLREATTATIGRSILALGTGDPAASLRHARAALRLAREVGNPTIVAWALAWEAKARQAAGDERALAVAEEAVRQAERARSWLPRSSAGEVAVFGHLQAGRPLPAALAAYEGLRSGRRRGGALFVSIRLGLSVPVLIAAEHPETAARVLGAFLEMPASRYPTVGPLVAAWRTQLAERLGDDTFADHLADGAALPLADAAALAEDALAELLAR